jgi:hypothetical protein
VAGWDVHPELSYSEYGERGSIDLLALRRAERAAAVFEIKVDVASVEGTVRKHDEKVRLAPALVTRTFGWVPRVVARILVLPEDSTARRAVARHSVTFGAAYPASSRDVRAWLRRPAGTLAGVWFLSVKPRGVGRRSRGGPKRVRGPATTAG